MVFRWVVVWPSLDDDEFAKWFFASAIFSGVPWAVNLVIVLLIAFSLEKRTGLARCWILTVWSFVLVWDLFGYLRGGVIVNPVWQSAIQASLEAFAFPDLFAFLIILWLAMALESRVSKTSSI